MKGGLMTFAGTAAGGALVAAAATMWLALHEPARLAQVAATGEPTGALRAIFAALVVVWHAVLRFL